MLIVADTHVHFYRRYRVDGLMQRVVAAMTAPAWGTDFVRVLCLAEKAGISCFRDLKSGRFSFPGFEARSGQDSDSLLLTVPGGKVEDGLYVIAGRQVATAERLEVLALGRDVSVPDGLPVLDTVARIAGQDAVPVLSWAVGKWTFARAKTVENLFTLFDPASLLVGDSSMRPACFGEPKLMSYARSRMFSVIAGSDPLPCPGEERFIGSYGSLMKWEFSHANPSDSIRHALRSRTFVGAFGKRRGISRIVRGMILQKFCS